LQQRLEFFNLKFFKDMHRRNGKTIGKKGGKNSDKSQMNDFCARYLLDFQAITPPPTA
jgi:hypothetical protein